MNTTPNQVDIPSTEGKPSCDNYSSSHMFDNRDVITPVVSNGHSHDTEHEADNSTDSSVHDEQHEELETLSRVSSGPPYTVFSPRMKAWIVAMNCVSAIVSPMTANIYFPAIPAISKDLGVSIGKVNLSLTTYMIFQGLAPTFFGDLGDVAGRRPAFIISFTIYLAANIGLALQRSYAGLLVLRALQSAGSSGTIALVFAVVADIAPSSERGKYMGIIGAGINVGPSIGPTIGGLITQYLSWPAIFWFCVILTVVWMFPYVLAVPETGRKIVGNGSIPPQGWNMTLVDYIRFRRQPRDGSITRPKQKFPIPNPLNTLKMLTHKNMLIVLLYNAMLYLGFMLLAVTLSSQLEEIYHFNDLQLGLCYLPLGGASAISSVCQGFIIDWNYRRTARKIGFKIDRKRGDNLKGFPIERVRIQVIYPLVAIGTVAFLGFGWALHYETHVAIPLALTFFIGLCVTGSFSIMNTLIVDLAPDAPATATAANNLVRCLFGAVASAVIDDMIHTWGRGWAYTFFAMVFFVPSPSLWIIQKYGPKWREEARLKKVGEFEKQQQDNMESKGEQQDRTETGEDVGVTIMTTKEQ